MGIQAERDGPPENHSQKGPKLAEVTTIHKGGVVREIEKRQRRRELSV